MVKCMTAIGSGTRGGVGRLMACSISERCVELDTIYIVVGPQWRYDDALAVLRFSGQHGM